MSSNIPQQGDFSTMLDNLRQDLKEHRQETREDIKSLEVKTDAWREEVRHEFGDVKSRLTSIETQIASKEKSFSHLTGWVGMVMGLASLIVLWFKNVH